MLYLNSINTALHELMAADSQIILLGEDLLDPYGGAFKVSKGLSTAFPDQVISTPISEQAITGAAIGMAMRGMKPIVEIMFGDFLSLCFDQILNHATKYHWMFNEQVTVPIVIRTPMGGGRGYGPTHSQSIENMFMPVPHLLILAPSIFHNPGEMLSKCVIDHEHPALFIENKQAYPKTLQLSDRFGDLHISRDMNPRDADIVYISLYPDEQAELVIITYGGMSEIAAQASVELFMENEILVDVLVVGQIRPLQSDHIIELIGKTERVLVLEEGYKIGGWGAEVASVVHERKFETLRKPVARIGAEDMPIPSAMQMESQVLPSVHKVKQAIVDMI